MVLLTLARSPLRKGEGETRGNAAAAVAGISSTGVITIIEYCCSDRVKRQKEEEEGVDPGIATRPDKKGSFPLRNADTA